MYKQIQSFTPEGIVLVKTVKRSDNVYIPLAPDNTDYQQFKRDIANGIQLQDATGTAMTAEQITTFLGTLP
jgi:hypothetical protein